MAKIAIEVDLDSGKKTLIGGREVPLKNLTLTEDVGGAVVKHKVLSISEGAEIRTNPGCYWVMIGGVLTLICPP